MALQRLLQHLYICIHSPEKRFPRKENAFLTCAADKAYSSAAKRIFCAGLLAKDRKGNLKASRVLQLREIARKSGYPQLIEATDIIQNAYRPVDTCQFISVSYKDDKGVKQTLPLSLAAME